jgi:hypothetical protein
MIHVESGCLEILVGLGNPMLAACDAGYED